MAAVPEQFEGFMIHDSKNWSTFTKEKFTPKVFEEHDVDIQSECCGVCGSDLHLITGGWGDLPTSPICIGHEVIGKVLRVGSKVTTCKAGDRVGVGAQIQSCLKCKNCKEHNENYCPHKVDTYGAPYNEDEGHSKEAMKDKNGKQIFSQGGYSSHIRAHEYFVFPIPENIPSVEAAPMMCAGLTTYSPLVRANIGPGKKVAILGIGGLGHFALLFARALGAEVWALSHTPDKKEEALKLGAHHFVSTKDKDWAKPLAFNFDFILNSADMTNEFDLPTYFGTLACNGEFHNVGLPDKPLPEMMAQIFASNGCKLTGSHIGNREEALAMLKLVSEKKLKPMIETIDISEEGCKKAVEKVKVNDVRYRVTLTGFDKAFGTK
ncbi:NADP-dependent alcohol dehydrogenase 6 [Lachnellula arida]|uniref:alcohol dehydrogenase (NADP(+)) n=1 Tax=Lachnellula arida TaxID=1316785 RepID=A0A8T9B6R1_9HELO|nr:NADP-dependent alcohol dehydrogenase 6 [Lachnellula arida]